MIAKNVHRRTKPFYIESDGTPMGETPEHIQNMVNTLVALNHWFRDDPMAYIGGNMFVHYEKGNRRKHLSPDIFVVRGIPKIRTPSRRSFRVWEDKAPDFVLELTSESTAQEDLVHKRDIYQNILKVREYFLFDPFQEHLTPALQGFRLEEGVYAPIDPSDGRLPSEVLGLLLEGAEDSVRFLDPKSKERLQTPEEVRAELEASEAEKQKAEKALQRSLAAKPRAAKAIEKAEAAKRESDEAREKAEAELERLRRELNELRGRDPLA